MTTHCNLCSQPTAMLAIQGERSSQFVCQLCGHTFEKDNHPGNISDFQTAARPRFINLAPVAGLPGIFSKGQIT